ncbi:uncharacterized protein PHACADRAFT_198544 [Phanerochaete carnosa HHB-10118-sp]|uniref:Cytochrome P450 n=1 Tax=Phanerochaete carnosa (strain HHB-10118-sp) TaxID=650164 RepID=K5W072_PHACS|nr:uncharacterized protein PHACADRAFT_198544 [Phanerochaete carnosa HHB-10118-sp]EKM52485.1 hypothetical protein PHACADRAFT_198544 [Phanerochaete carnosa HHB-10118-sp]
MSITTHSSLLAFAPTGLALLTHAVFHYYEPPKPIVPVLTIVLACPAAVVALVGDWCAWNVAKTYLVYALSLFTSITAYRLSPVHPLSKYPGPVLFKVSKLPCIPITIKGERHLLLKTLHAKYGPVVRVGPNDLSIVDADAIPAVLGAGGLVKGRFYDIRRDPTAPSNLLAMSGDAHANRRRLWNRSMSSESLKDYEELIVTRVTQLVERLEGLAGPVDLVSWINYFTFDFMGDMAFGGGFHMLEDGADKTGLWGVIETFAASVEVISQIPWCAQLQRKIPMVARNLQALRTMGVGCATARLKNGSTKKDLWYHLSDEAGLEKEKPATRDVIADGTLTIIAGADTTSSAMASLFWFLLTHPECYRRLQTEVDAVYPSGEDALDVSKHGGLKYLAAIINETLRLAPPVPTGGPRELKKGMGSRVIAGHVIPEGTQIYLPPYVYHRNPCYWPGATDDFVPERWLEPAAQQNFAAFVPFSYGPANCVGKNLARREMTMVVSLLVQKFEFTFADGFDWQAWPDTLRDYFILTRGPLLVTLRERQARKS